MNSVGNGEMGKWGNGEMGKWGNGEMGKWGNGAAVSSPYHPITLSPDDRRPTPDN
ncbi:hypothetical protein [Microcystis aeruginosa]|uniref:hypothetical protein n=1 Tax=Microcystis aeruginosa TaxID=1126 RepID=UPI001558A349|nr:hypothetical protein [Microcystis aeruginosa]